MVIYLTGSDTFRSRERLKVLRDAFVKKFDPSGTNVTTLDGGSMKPESFAQAISSGGLLSTKRFVIVERPFDADRKVQDAIAGALKEKHVPEDAIVVFWNGELTKKRGKDRAEPSALAAILARMEHYEEFAQLDPSEVGQWIGQRVKMRSGTITRAAAEQLAAAVGTDLWLASNEIDKLVHQHAGSSITEADVRQSISVKTEANIFEFTDALSRKDQKAALTTLEDLFVSGANELYLLTMIARQVRILISIADIAASEPNQATIASRLSLHPFVVKKALGQIRTFSKSELLRAHDELVDIDFRLKNTRSNPRALLELFVIRLCSGRP